MEKKKLKLKKETLSNLTNLNIREIEEFKGGKALQMDVSISVSVSDTGLTVSYSYSAGN